jgi:hypothetical protein
MELQDVIGMPILERVDTPADELRWMRTRQTDSLPRALRVPSQ